MNRQALTTAIIFLLLAGISAGQDKVTTWTVSIVVPKPSTAVLTPGEILLRFTASGESISGQQLAEAIIARAVDKATFKGQALYRSVTLQAAERCRKVALFEPDAVSSDADWKADGTGWESIIKPTPLGAVRVTVKGESSWWVEPEKPPEPPLSLDKLGLMRVESLKVSE